MNVCYIFFIKRKKELNKFWNHQRKPSPRLFLRCIYHFKWKILSRGILYVDTYITYTYLHAYQIHTYHEINTPPVPCRPPVTNVHNVIDPYVQANESYITVFTRTTMRSYISIYVCILLKYPCTAVGLHICGRVQNLSYPNVCLIYYNHILYRYLFMYLNTFKSFIEGCDFI